MPAPQAAMLANLVKNNFRAKNIVVPPDFKGFSDQFHEIDPKNVAPPPPTSLFRNATSYELHVKTAKDCSKWYSDFIDDVCGAICKNWAQWQASTKFVGVIINATMGILPPGGMVGPPVMSGGPLLLSVKLAGKSVDYIKWAKAIVTAIGNAWTAWQTGFTHTSLTFPGGAVCSVTMIPSPNVPTPISAGMSPGEALMNANALKNLMMANLGNPRAPHAADTFDAFAQAFNTVFTQWKSTTMITNIIGAAGVAPPPPSPPGPVAAALGNGGMLP